MDYDRIKRDKNIMSILNSDYIFVEEFHRILLFKKKSSKTNDTIFYGIYPEAPEIINKDYINFNNITYYVEKQWKLTASKKKQDHFHFIQNMF